MEQIQNYGSVIIDLDGAANGNTTVTNTATYDQAFLGEPFSEARGKGRARRKKRKLERIKNKREVKTERRKIKSDRQEERIGRRAKRKSSRQEMRDSQQEARMNRRNKRAEEKESRNAEEDTQDPETEETTTPSDSYSDDTSDSGNYASDSEDSGDYADDSEDSGDYADDSEDSGDYADDFAGEQSNFVSELNGGTSTSPIVDTICMKIEWNNEMISRLMAAKNKMESKGQDTSKVTNALGQKFDRVQQLEGKLENFAGADGRVNPKKQKAVQMARVRARKQRMLHVIPAEVIESLTAKGMTKPQIKEYWATKGREIYYGKNASIRKSRADGDAPNDEEEIDVSYWGQPAYDNDEATEVLVDLDSNKEPNMNFSGIDGSTSNKKMWRTLLIGGIVGFTAIYFIRKYKLLK